MIADSFFSIGSTHRVCEDYATHWHIGNTALAIVCDGCSDSPKTDVGARFLAETFSACVRSPFANPKEFSKDGFTVFGANLRNLQRMLSANPAWFDTTLLACIAHEETQSASLFIWGDGHLRIEHETGEVTALDVDFHENNNAPFYPSYQIFRQNGREEYEAAYGPLTPKRTWTSNVLPEPDLDREYPSFDIPLQGIKSISLYSDGVGSFLEGIANIPMEVERITAQLQDFKILGEGALTRRARKCEKLWRKTNIQHTDDLGVASIIFPQETDAAPTSSEEN